MSAQIVALVGCLVSALLPMGQMPKLAGPCGRELCECVVQQPQNKKCDGREDCPFRAPEVEWVFEGPTFSASVPPTILITVVTEFKMPALIAAPEVAAQKDALEAPQSPLFALASVTDDIATPPPRA
jgi:hypothetical protein